MNKPSQDVEQDLYQFGERLALLLANADIPQDQQDAWAALIPHMSIEQLDQLAKILEQRLKIVSPSDEEVMRDLQQAQEQYDQKTTEIQKRAEKDLADIEAMLSGES